MSASPLETPRLDWPKRGRQFDMSPEQQYEAVKKPYLCRRRWLVRRLQDNIPLPTLIRFERDYWKYDYEYLSSSKAKRDDLIK